MSPIPNKTAFSMFSNSVQAQRAKSKYEGETFMDTFEHAKEGDRDAIVYLLVECMPQIASVFKKSYPNIKSLFGLGYTELSHEYFNDFLYSVFHSHTQGRGIFLKFKPEVFKEKDDDFLLNKLGYYVMQYAKTYWNKKIRDEKEGKVDSLDSVTSKKDDSVTMKDELESNFDNLEDSAVENSEKEDFILFLKSLAGRRTDADKKKLETLIRLKYDDVPSEDILKALNITRFAYYRMLDSLKEVYKLYVQHLQAEREAV